MIVVGKNLGNFHISLIEIPFSKGAVEDGSAVIRFHAPAPGAYAEDGPQTPLTLAQLEVLRDLIDEYIARRKGPVGRA